MPFSVVLCRAVPSSAVLCRAVQCGAVQCRAVPYSAVPWSGAEWGAVQCRAAAHDDELLGGGAPPPWRFSPGQALDICKNPWEIRGIFENHGDFHENGVSPPPPTPVAVQHHSPSAHFLLYHLDVVGSSLQLSFVTLVIIT
eukprot:gene14997-biopygen3637